MHFAEKQGVYFFLPIVSVTHDTWLDPRMGLLCVSSAYSVCISTAQRSSFYSQSETVKRIPPKNYSENYVYKPRTLRIMRTK